MPGKGYRYADFPPIPMASVAPGRVHFYDMPAHWHWGGRPTGNCAKAGAAKAPPDPERAAHRARRCAIEAAGWLWLKSRQRYEELPSGDRIPFRQAFWTLTVPEAMPEERARVALSSWWTWARNVAGVESYLWVAELTKRGRVHFHAIVNEWIDIGEASRAWHRALMREGVGHQYEKPPASLCDVEPVKSAGKARGYVSKYIGKDFGGRADQLKDRLLRNYAGHDGFDVEHRPELVARLADQLRKPTIGKRRWGATVDLERRPIQVNGCDDTRILRSVCDELMALPGAYWGKDGEKGRPCYYDLDAITVESAPVLHGLLHQ